MFACLSSLSMPLAALIALAEEFTPRYEAIGSLVMLDISGLSRLFGTPREIGEQLRLAAGGPVRIAIAPTQTAAAFLALGRAGLTVVSAADTQKALAPLAVSLLGDYERIRLGAESASSKSEGRSAPRSSSHPSHPVAPAAPLAPPSVGAMWDALPYFHSTLSRTSDAAAAPYLAASEAHLEVASTRAPSGGGWSHPRDSHAAAHTRRQRRAGTTARDLEHPPSLATDPRVSNVATAPSNPSHPVAPLAPAAPLAPLTPRAKTTERAIADLLSTLRRWGVKTFGDLVALPPGDVYERLGARGVTWQRLGRGEDLSPLVPWVPDDPFEAALDLEWPIEGLEPLSFVLARLLEPLDERLERADRGAAIVHTHLRLVD
ncbi:MAG TPA: hypothetical protein VMS14_09895, partial [Ilumatobacteraceae bacterium]|nr:hypothetical protein [Ilumatobacteraceae bacterium]